MDSDTLPNNNLNLTKLKKHKTKKINTVNNKNSKNSKKTTKIKKTRKTIIKIKIKSLPELISIFEIEGDKILTQEVNNKFFINHKTTLKIEEPIDPTQYKIIYDKIFQIIDEQKQQIDIEFTKLIDLKTIEYIIQNIQSYKINKLIFTKLENDIETKLFGIIEILKNYKFNNLDFSQNNINNPLCIKIVLKLLMYNLNKFTDSKILNISFKLNPIIKTFILNTIYLLCYNRNIELLFDFNIYTIPKNKSKILNNNSEYDDFDIEDAINDIIRYDDNSFTNLLKDNDITPTNKTYIKKINEIINNSDIFKKIDKNDKTMDKYDNDYFIKTIFENEKIYNNYLDNNLTYGIKNNQKMYEKTNDYFKHHKLDINLNLFVLDLHGRIRNNIFKLPENINIVYLSSVGFSTICNTNIYKLDLKKKDLLFNFFRSQPCFEKDKPNVFHQSVIYYGGQYCIDIDISKNDIKDRYMGLYLQKPNMDEVNMELKEIRVPGDTEKKYDNTLSNFLNDFDTFKDSEGNNIYDSSKNYTIILTSCRQFNDNEDLEQYNPLIYFEKINKVVNFVVRHKEKANSTFFDVCNTIKEYKYHNIEHVSKWRINTKGITRVNSDLRKLYMDTKINFENKGNLKKISELKEIYNKLQTDIEKIDFINKIIYYKNGKDIIKTCNYFNSSISKCINILCTILFNIETNKKKLSELLDIKITDLNNEIAEFNKIHNLEKRMNKKVNNNTINLSFMNNNQNNNNETHSKKYELDYLINLKNTINDFNFPLLETRKTKLNTKSYPEVSVNEDFYN